MVGSGGEDTIRRSENLPFSSGDLRQRDRGRFELVIQLLNEQYLGTFMQSNLLDQQDLYERIDRTRYADPLEDGKFHYGFNSTYLKKVVSYWRHEFDWKKQVAVLNKYPHFKTKIEGT